jgi:nitrogen regulatory protein P-II 1
MQLLLLVLNKIEKMDELLEALVAEGITGATILSSIGMVRELSGREEYLPIFGSAWLSADPDRKESKTIFLVLSNDQISKARNVIHQVIGDMSKPDTAVLFTLPVLSAEGIGY